MTKQIRKLSEKELKSLYKYKDDDMVYDIESLSNVFTASQIYPVAPEQYRKIIISILDDGYRPVNSESNELQPIIQTQADLEYLKKRIFEINHMLNPNTPIYFEMLNNFHGDPNSSETLTPNVGMGTFMERYGVSYNNQAKRNANIDWHYYPTMETDAGLIEAMIDNNNHDYPAMKNMMDDAKTVAKQLEIANHFDPDFTKDGNLGLRLGYNSQNYDMTVLAYMMHELQEHKFTAYGPHDNSVDKIPNDKITNAVTASKLRDFNNLLFSEFKNNMSQGLSSNLADPYEKNYRDAYAIRQQWLHTNRYIDVAKLNEKLSKIGLKRLSGVLGFPIIESNLLDENTSTIDDRPDKDGNQISALERLAELIAYNLSDAINTQRLFEQSLYQSNYKVKSNLLKQYPQLIFEKNPKTGKPYTSGFNHVRRDRIIADATSAKFIENVIAPYDELVDNECISFMYPSERKAKELGIQQFNVLDDSMKWAQEHNLQEAFQPIYDYYKKYEHTNANPKLDNKYPKTSDIDLSNMNNKYFYRDAEGNPTASLTVFTIGGIHGAEVKLDVLNQDIENAEKLISYQHELEEMFGSPEAAYSYKLDDINPETGKKYRLGESPITMSDGTIVTAKSLLKSSSTSKKAVWKDIKMPTLYDNTGIRDKYRYTSHGPAHHEDFSSYYPALLSNLEVFYDAKNHVDVYNQIYLGRLGLKKQLKLESDKLMWNALNEKQTAFKLLLNAASGAADPKSPNMNNKIRKNNAIVSMRIIGQLFSWRIGQAQALQGARLPSVNTDGLYVMGIDAETNKRTLDEVVQGMLIKVDPEEVDRFVSKDTNNRLEVYTDGRPITPANVTDFAAKGGKLTSYNGPSIMNTLDHPAAIDHALGDYLGYIDNAVDLPFDRNIGRDILSSIFTDYPIDEALRFFQWIIASSPATPRIAFAQTLHVNEDGTYDRLDVQGLQRYNRVFLTKPADPSRIQTLQLASAAKAKSKKAIDEYSPDRNLATQILINANALPNQNSEEPKIPRISKISGMPELQNVTIDNRDILEIVESDIINNLDTEAYIDLLEKAFNTYAN